MELDIIAPVNATVFYACVHSVVNNQNSIGAYVVTPIKIINK